MKKIIKTSLLIFPLIAFTIMSGCDAFENFVFGLPISVKISTTGNDNTPSGFQTFCLEQDPTYRNYSDKLNSIVFVEAHVVVESISADDINAVGNGTLRLFEGTGPTGTPLFVNTVNNIRPSDYTKPNSYLLELSAAQIAALNSSLKNNSCFYADYVFTVTSGGSAPYVIEFRIDALYNVDAKL